MNSKQRVNTALSLEMTDRAPLGFFAIDSDTASKVLGRETFWRAKAKCQIAYWQGRRDEVVESLIADGIELYKKLDIIDIVCVGVSCAGTVPPKDYDPNPPKQLDNDTWEDKQGRVYKYSQVTKDITVISDPTVWTNEYKLEDMLWDGTEPVVDDSVFEVVDAITNEFKDDRFVIGSYGYIQEWLLLGSMERGFMEMINRPDEVKQIFDNHIDKAIAEDKYYIRPGQDGVIFGTDFASTSGPMISPAMYRELFLDGVKKRFVALHDRNQKVIKHACGNNKEFLDTFADMGFDCYQSIQATAGMDMAEIQKSHGDKFALWGGVNVENLIEGTQEDINRDVIKTMELAKRKPGVILGTSHSVATGTRYENFMALLDQYSSYL